MHALPKYKIIQFQDFGKSVISVPVWFKFSLNTALKGTVLEELLYSLWTVNWIPPGKRIYAINAWSNVFFIII